MTTRVGLWARLTNAKRSIYIASGDWQRILMGHSDLFSSGEDRWSKEEGTVQVTAEEALTLSGIGCCGRQTMYRLP